MQAEILARIFGLLDWQQLSQVEAVSRRCRSVGKQVWRGTLPGSCPLSSCLFPALFGSSQHMRAVGLL